MDNTLVEILKHLVSFVDLLSYRYHVGDIKTALKILVESPISAIDVVEVKKVYLGPRDGEFYRPNKIAAIKYVCRVCPVIDLPTAKKLVEYLILMDWAVDLTTLSLDNILGENHEV